MSQIKCPECNKEISDKAVECPNCGYPIKDQLEEHNVIEDVTIYRNNKENNLNDNILIKQEDSKKINIYYFKHKKMLVAVPLIIIIIVAFLLLIFKSNDTKEISINNKVAETTHQDNEIYNIGDRVLINDKYAITIVGINETQKRNMFEKKNYRQVITIDYLYENLSSEGYISIDQSYFEILDEDGSVCDSYPVYNLFEKQTPIGAKCQGSFSIGSNNINGKITLNFYDKIYNSQTKRFKLNVGENINVKPLLTGKASKYENAYGIGEIIEIKTNNGKYAIRIDEITKITDFDKTYYEYSENLFEIKYTYFNIDYYEGNQGLILMQANFRGIDSNGTMAGAYLDRGNIRILPGEQCTAVMGFGTYADSQNLVLHFCNSISFDEQTFVIDTSKSALVNPSNDSIDSINLFDLYGKDKEYVINILGNNYNESKETMSGGIALIYDDIYMELDLDNYVSSIYLNREDQKQLDKYAVLGVNFEKNNEEIYNEVGVPYSGNKDIFIYKLDDFTWLKLDFNTDGAISEIRIFMGPDHDGEGFSW